MSARFLLLVVEGAGEAGVSEGDGVASERDSGRVAPMAVTGRDSDRVAAVSETEGDPERVAAVSET